MGILGNTGLKGDDAEDGSSGSTLGTPSRDNAEAPPGDDESFVVSGGGVANAGDDEADLEGPQN